MDKEWKKVELGQVVKLVEDERIEGEFINIKPSAQFDKSFALKMKVNNEDKVIFVNSILMDKLESAKIKSGQMIAILYLGLKKSQDGKKKYHDYELFYQ